MGARAGLQLTNEPPAPAAYEASDLTGLISGGSWEFEFYRDGSSAWEPEGTGRFCNR